MLFALGTALGPPLGAQTSSTTSDNAKAQVATIRFAQDAGNAIFLSVRLNARSARWWALDSGASECIVDRGEARLTVVPS